MNKTYIFNNYNLNKILSAKQLAELSKTYIDNEKTIIVMMSKKKKPPQQPPQWFKEFVESINDRFDKIESRFDNLENEVHSQFKAHGWTK